MLRMFRATLAVAAAEARSARRSTRTWVFVALGAAIAFGAYAYYFYVHGYMSAFLPVAGYYSPRFQAAAINVYLLWVFVTGAAFLAFDIGARDVRVRVADVVDSRPLSNMALLTGRLIGVLCVAWLPILLVVLLVQVSAAVAREVGWWFGEPVEPFSQTAFVLLDSLPILTFWIAFVLLLDAVVRNRLVVLLAALSTLAVQIWAYGSAPLYLYGPLSPLSAQVGWASDMVPRLAEAEMVVQRGALVLFAAAFVCMAAVAHPRVDRTARGPRLAAAGVLAVLAVSGIAWAVWQSAADLNVRTHWRAVHEEVKAAPGVADVEQIAGEVVVVPGVRLQLDLRMTLARPPGATRLTFSFNPGMRVLHLSVRDQAVPFSHEDGLLVFDLPQSLAPGDRATVRLGAVGVPDPRFAYLDSAVDWRQRPADSPLALLGTEPALFDRRFVALMPAIAWLPVAGPNLARPGSETDFFKLDLTVEAPSGWLVAVPGRREQIDGDGNRVRFRPAWAVAEVGLLASQFERFARTVAGVDVELLLHPEHLENVAYFADAADALATRIEQLLSRAEDHGIPYPLDSLSVVEVPTRLRGYRGGWRLGTAMALPGVLLIKEQGPPTVSYRGPLAKAQAAQGDVAKAKLAALARLALNDDLTGGDVSRGLAHNLFSAFTHARGPGADALNFVCAELTYRLLLNNRIPHSLGFSAHRFDFDAAFGAAIRHAGLGMASGQPSLLPLLGARGRIYHSSVWSLLSTVPLADLERHNAPSLAEDAMLLRGASVALVMYDGLGRSGAGAVLAELRRRFAGRTFDADEFSVAAESAGVDMNALLGDWLTNPGLPGYLVDEARVVRLADEAGAQRYQVRVHVRNDEPVPGVFRVSTDAPGFVTRGTDPIRIPAATSMEAGLVLSEPPNQLWLHPYASRNRRSIRIGLADFDPAEIVRQEALEGGGPSDWRPRRNGIVVDDLDPGFAVSGNASGTRLGGFGSAYGGFEIDMDQGLPVIEQQRGAWFRPQVPSAWGKYRQTAALVHPGRGTRRSCSRLDWMRRGGSWLTTFRIDMCPRHRASRPNAHLPCSTRPVVSRCASSRAVVRRRSYGSMPVRRRSAGTRSASSTWRTATCVCSSRTEPMAKSWSPTRSVGRAPQVTPSLDTPPGR